jgi:phage gpG-like protein
MSNPVTITIDSKQVNQKLLRLAASLKNPKPMMDEIGLMGVTSVKRNFQTGGRPSKWKAPLFRTGKALRDTGDLMGSMDYEVQGKTILVGTNSIKAKIHHFGGIIRAKNVKALPIPLNAKAAKAQRNVKSVREIPDLALIPRKGKPPLLVKFKGRKSKSGAYSMKGASLEPWFILKKSVNMPARPFLMLQPQDAKRINAIIRSYVEIKV